MYMGELGEIKVIGTSTRPQVISCVWHSETCKYLLTLGSICIKPLKPADHSAHESEPFGSMFVKPWQIRLAKYIVCLQCTWDICNSGKYVLIVAATPQCMAQLTNQHTNSKTVETLVISNCPVFRPVLGSFYTGRPTSEESTIQPDPVDSTSPVYMRGCAANKW